MISKRFAFFGLAPSVLTWVSGAGTGGKLFEPRNPSFAKATGQNWGDCGSVGGTPGRANSLRSTNVAPVVTRLRHTPAVPTSSDPVTISCEVSG